MLLKRYYPLLVILLMSVLLALIFGENLEEITYRFMGFFLVFFSLFKWIDYKGFVVAFKEYDVTSKIFKPYPFLYPIIELVIGCGYLMLHFTAILNIATITIMFLNALSVAKAIAQKRQINCACLGTVIQLPLTTVSLFESLLMLLMAILMLR